MKNQIMICEAITETEVERFWEQLHTYHVRDIFPDPEDENRGYFLNDGEYRAAIQAVHDRPQDRCRYLFFCRGGTEIGFAMPVIFTSEDGKCFLMEFCVYPEYRGGGTGTACAKALLNWAKRNGACYAELNYGSHESRLRFWKRLGFVENGADEWGEPLLILPPEEQLPITVELLSDPEDWQMKKLENGFLTEIGETIQTEEQQERLQQAIKDGKIVFFLAKRGYRAVGMCSVVSCFSTFTCSDIGIFDDFYVEPVFRKCGTARKLAEAAQEWCKKQGIASLMVCCSSGDVELYRSLGFDVKLGETLTFLC